MSFPSGDPQAHSISVLLLRSFRLEPCLSNSSVCCFLTSWCCISAQHSPPRWRTCGREFSPGKGSLRTSTGTITYPSQGTKLMCTSSPMRTACSTFLFIWSTSGQDNLVAELPFCQLRKNASAEQFHGIEEFSGVKAAWATWAFIQPQG